MKILIIGEQERSEAYMPALPIVNRCLSVFPTCPPLFKAQPFQRLLPNQAVSMLLQM